MVVSERTELTLDTRRLTSEEVDGYMEKVKKQFGVKLVLNPETGEIYRASLLGEGVPFQRDFETNGHFSDVRDEYKVRD